jgi:YD repeat-containing protein
MTDVERQRLHGPVHSVRTEWASIDPQTSEWEPFRDGPTLTYDRNGRQEGRRRDTGEIVSTFDERGLRTTISQFGPAVRRPPGLEYGIGMDASVKFDVLAHFDASDRPVEIVYRNTAHKALHRIKLEYDDAGRLVRETVLLGDVLAGEVYTSANDAGQGGPPTPEQIEQLWQEIRRVTPDGVSSAREYIYNDRGQVAQMLESMGPVWNIRRSFTYDAQGQVVEDHYQGRHCEATVDPHGNVVTSNEGIDESWNRFEYRYDEHGNWIEKVTLRREAPDRSFQRTSMERRAIEYYQ